MTFTFDIPNAKVQRISRALDKEGYVFTPGIGTTDQAQRIAFFKQLTIRYWQSIVFNAERADAIALEPNDNAFEQSKRFIGLSDIITD